MERNELQGKTAIVTGAGSGLGEATARALVGAGLSVACFDINGDAAARVAQALCDEGGQAYGQAVDVGTADEVFDGVEEANRRFGRVDIVVNNAAVDHTVSVDDMTVEQWDQVVSVNLRGPFLMAKAVFPIMRQQNYGHIFNVASTAATRAWGNAAAYHASKWGLVGFSRGLGVEGRPFGIRVTTIIPGGMRTHFFDRFESQGIPMPDLDNLQDPANVADVIVQAARMPLESVIQEVMVTPLTETSWP